MTSKQKLRQLLKTKRTATDMDVLLLHQKCIDYLSCFQSIGMTVSFGDEIDTYELIKWLLKNGKTVSCPKIRNKTMKFFPIQSFDDLKKGAFDILEPITDVEVIPECLVVPMLGYNENNYRIGYGGGYFDRYLKLHPVKTVGMAFDWMKVDFKPDDWDIPLDLIIT